MRFIEQIQLLDFYTRIPSMLLEVEQRLDTQEVEDIAFATRWALEQSSLLDNLSPGMSVALGVGSRGIKNISVIVKTVIERLRELHVKPFIIPAMGSHGGATAEGQRAILAELGITSKTVGAEIRATMKVKKIGSLPGGPDLFQDINAANADATLLINRVKPHTDFQSNIESGLSKMAVIGLGKRRGAEAMHRYGARGFREFLSPAARIYERNTNLIGGLAIIENAFGKTNSITALIASQIGGLIEKNLLKKARSLLPKLPFSEIDILVLREIGKDISGTGMDTNVIGRLMIPREPENINRPDIAVITVLDLSKGTKGNAAGLGLANITTIRVVEKIDWISTYTNSVISGIFGMGRSGVPMTMSNDQKALQVAVRCCGRAREDVRIVFAKNTCEVKRLWISLNLRNKVESNPNLAIIRKVPLSFSPEGVMTSPWLLD